MKNAEQPINPIKRNVYQGGNVIEAINTGLTKREYLAGLAMQGILSDPNVTLDSVAKMAVKVADDLLNELEKSDKGKKATF